MLKKLIFGILILSCQVAMAENNCDVRVGTTIGLKVVEFASGNVIHSKMSLKDSSPEALIEEMINLQDLGLCTEKIPSKKCVLKIEKKPSMNLTLYRGSDRWHSWKIKSKRDAEIFVRNMKRNGFCS